MKTLAAVIGNPIKHSRSPRMHNHWLNILGIDGRYDRVLAPLDGFADTVRDLMARGYAGANVTIPFKEEALAVADVATPLARSIGAANTLVFRDGKIHADNTDGYGFARNIQAAYPEWDGAGRHIVLGAGGAARAIVGWLLQNGAEAVVVVNRNLDRARALAAIDGRIVVSGWDQIGAHYDGARTIINTTSRGMDGANDIVLDFARVDAATIVNDIVYTPQMTRLLRDAAAAGLRWVGGLGMLLWQARPGFQAWFGVAPPAIDAGLENLMLTPRILGLTGSIGMGKSTVAMMFVAHGYHLDDADANVRALYDKDDELAAFIRQHCPAAYGVAGFDRAIWREFVLARPEVLAALEGLIHGKLRAARRQFLEADRAPKILDIPLLFETDQASFFDAVVVVSADEAVRRERVLARGTLDAAMMDTIISRQMPDALKRARADYVIDTGVSLAETRAAVAELVAGLG